MATAAPRTMTIEEFSEFEGDTPCDLIDGELVEMAAGARHGMIASAINIRIGIYLLEHIIGRTFMAETTFVLSVTGRTAVRPDAAFLRNERIPPPSELSNDVPYAPDLAVEVVSPSDRASAVNRKVQAYLEAGTLLVWVVDPIRQTVLSYSIDGRVRFYGATDTLDGGEVLPGFALPLTELFDL
jgi:Uma2 family endonuclease